MYVRLLIGCLIFSAAGLCAAQDPAWVTLKGRIVFDGTPPRPDLLDIERDADVCGDIGLVDESLTVNPQNSGIRHIAVWIESKSTIPVHPDLAAVPEKPLVVDNLDCRFEPRMIALRTGQKLLLRNSDPIAHNAAVYVRRNTPFSMLIPQTGPLERSFPKPETLPVRVDCSIHSWMRAWLILQDHPYMTVTDENGLFVLKHVPAGEWKFRFWHERPGHLQHLIRNGTRAPLEKGAWQLKLDGSSTLDLGELRAPAEQFAPKK